MLKTYMIYIKNYIITLRLGYEKPTAFTLCASVLDIVAFVRLTLFKTKQVTKVNIYYYKVKKLKTKINIQTNTEVFIKKKYLIFNIQSRNLPESVGTRHLQFCLEVP
ncbi:hypothetical protein Hanom_Chr07g00632581 [Helianthus anomalus]